MSSLALIHPPALSEENVFLHIHCRQQTNYYKVLHERALVHIKVLNEKHNAEVEKLNFKISKLEKKIFGTSSEKSKNKSESSDKPKGKKRGQALGAKGHGRTVRSPDIPVIEEKVELSIGERTCSKCNCCFQEIFDAETSLIHEIEIKAHTRKISRTKYKTCRCNGPSKIVTAPAADRLFPKTSYGVSIWLKFITNKFILGIPVERTCKELKPYFGNIAKGTIIGGFKKISALFDTLMNRFHNKLLEGSYFHCDETFWKVFEIPEGKENHQWYIWGAFSEDVRYYYFAPNRSTKSIIAVFEGFDFSIKEMIIVCDRYSAYKCFIKGKENVILAFCWVHVRRDFLELGRSSSKDLDWALSWREDIGKLYEINKKRVAEWEKDKPLEEQSEKFKILHNNLVEAINDMKNRMLTELADCSPYDLKIKVLKSLKAHWDNLIHFVEKPFICMDNNLAERELRGLAVGRKNYYGSGSIWSAHFTGKIYTFFKTCELWKLDATKVLYYFLLACSQNGGKEPDDLTRFIPWEMSEEQKFFYQKPMSMTIVRPNSFDALVST